jgi:ketosteroid isomerase-like protein
MSDQNNAVVLKFMEAMGTNDPKSAAECITPDAVAVAKGFGKFAGSRGADVMIGMIEAFAQMVPTGLRFTISRVIVDGDNVAVEADGNAVTSQGKPYCNQYCFVFTLRDGKISHVNEYFCHVHANEVLWPIVEAMGVGAAEPAS